MDFGPRPLHATRKRLIIENVVEDQSGEPVLDVKDKRISFRHEPSFSCLICAGGIFCIKEMHVFCKFPQASENWLDKFISCETLASFSTSVNSVMVSPCSWLIKGEFGESLELQNFPFDTQDLTVTLRVGKPLDHVRTWVRRLAGQAGFISECSFLLGDFLKMWHGIILIHLKRGKSV